MKDKQGTNEMNNHNAKTQGAFTTELASVFNGVCVFVSRGRGVGTL